MRVVVFILGFLAALSDTVAGSTDYFIAARPVWALGRSEELNSSLRFVAEFEADEGSTVSLVVTGSSVYRISLNGCFAGYGPARGPAGKFRVDEWTLSDRIVSRRNLVEIEVSAYNVKNYYYPCHRAFIQAEILVDGKLVAATGSRGFKAFETERLRKTSRYSYQRGFGEVYRKGAACGEVPIVTVPAVPLMSRTVPYPRFDVTRLDAFSRTFYSYEPRAPWKTARFIEDAGGLIGGFKKDELEENIYADVQRLRIISSVPAEGECFTIRDGEGALFRGQINNTGFLRARVNADKGSRLVFAFDEVLGADGLLDATRGGVANAVVYEFANGGSFEVESLEPYTFKYVHAYVTRGKVEVSNVSLREYCSPLAVKGDLGHCDATLRCIHEAARATFAQNAVDVFTDCPGRERAGWLCDSFWTARASHYFTGSLTLERVFLENFAEADSFDIPAGMIPMCYPADSITGTFIPNWGMWLAIELEDYIKRGGDIGIAERLKPLMKGFKAFMDSYRNDDGLLENLPGWVFVEWSRANSLVQDVNYPSNMLWARALDSLSAVYGRQDFAAEAARIREIVRGQSWTGEWFCDNAIRGSDRKLSLSGECTETCQYYAFFTGVADAASHPRLWQRLVSEFGPSRKKSGAYPEVCFSNAFIGNFLRLEILCNAGLKEQVNSEIAGYFAGMADCTGTLWEHDAPSASCCHGFASYVAVLISRCATHGGGCGNVVRQLDKQAASH